jgi:ankyrin repeat protein
MRIAEREIDESLISAATWGDVADVRALLAQGADPSAFRSLDDGRRFWCALNYAIEEDHADVVACLVHAGADVNWSSQSHVGWTPLLHAVDAESDSANQTGSPMDLRLISPILAGAAIDLTVADYSGTTALDMARQYGHVAAIEAIERRARTNTDQSWQG